MSKINYSSTNGGYNLAVINQNFATTADLLNNKVLWRDNPSGEPNQMFNDLDMNSNRIINLPEPIAGTEPLRKQDLTNFLTNGIGIITSQFTQIVTSVAGIRGLNKLNVKQAIATGYYAAGDLGGGIYNFDATDTTSLDNGGTVIVATDLGRWKLQHHGSVSVAQFGAKCDGASDDITPLTAAIGASGFNELVIPGLVALSTGITSIPDGKLIRGLNRETCGFVALSNSMTFFTKTAPSIFTNGKNTFQELRFDGNAHTGVAGLSFILCFQMSVIRCKFVGCASPLTCDRGYYFNIFENHIENNSQRTGGFVFTSSTDFDYIFLVNVRGTTHFNNGNGIVVGSAQYFFRRAIDSSISDSLTFALTNGTDAAYWLIVENDCQNLRVVNSSVENSTSAILIRTGTGINVAPSFTKFIGVDCDQAYAGHVVHQSGIGTQFFGGSFTSSGVGLNFNAVFLTGGDQISFNGTLFHGYTTNPGGAVSMQNVTNVKLTACNINLCYNGITFGTGVTGARINNCSYINGAGGSAVNGSPAGALNLLRGNENFVNPGSLTTTPPASTATFTNVFGYDGIACISGGTVTQITLNGQITGAIAGTFPVRVGDTFSMTYSVTPSFNFIGQQ